MPRLIETESRTDVVVLAMNTLLATRGTTSLTLRTIARQSGVSTSSLLQHYGSREHLLRVGAHRTGRARQQSIDRRLAWEGPLAFLPADEDDLLDAAAWLAWCELWRTEEGLQRTVRDARVNELGLLAHATGQRWGSDDLQRTASLVEGLVIAMCAPVEPLDAVRARTLLAQHLGLTDEREVDRSGG